jgi:hypothetical protein
VALLVVIVTEIKNEGKNFFRFWLIRMKSLNLGKLEIFYEIRRKQIFKKLNLLKTPKK